MTLIFFWGGGGGEEVRWKTVRTYGKILATPLILYFIHWAGGVASKWNSAVHSEI